MSADLAKCFDLGAVDQVGYVVPDLETAIACFEPLFGACTRLDADTKGTLFRGQPSDVKLRMAFFRSGPIEIEVIEPVSGASPHREFLDAGRQGAHHLRFRVNDLDAKLPELNAAGYQTIWYHRFSPEIAWAYLEAPGADAHNAAAVLIFELLEMPE